MHASHVHLLHIGRYFRDALGDGERFACLTLACATAQNWLKPQPE
jgi:hypothetical protein